MKKLLNYVMYVAAMVIVISLTTSCDEDEAQAMALSGEWQGDFGMSYSYVDADGLEYTFDATETRIVFYPDYNHALWGHGKQTDFYHSGPYKTQTYHFDWEVKDGVIYLDYPYDPELNCRIRDYHMTRSKFSGHIGSNSPKFVLRKVEDYYDWSPYINIYHNEKNKDWHCTRSAESQEVEGAVVKRFSRF